MIYGIVAMYVSAIIAYVWLDFVLEIFPWDFGVVFSFHINLGD